MKVGTRRLLFIPAALGLGALLLWGVAGLRGFGHYDGAYGLLLNHTAVAERHATNVVMAVTFDYRGFDTLGEEFMLFAAIFGVALLLREERTEIEQTPDDELPGRAVSHTSDAIRAVGVMFVGITALFGMYLTIHGHLTPGGGFQGGVVVASALLLIYLASDYKSFRRIVSKTWIQPLEAIGMAGFVMVGLLGPLQDAAFLENVLPLGRSGNLFSAGIIPLANIAVGMAVTFGLVLLVNDFMEQTLLIRAPRQLGHR